MAAIVAVHCTAGHRLRWQASSGSYTHVGVANQHCPLRADPTMTTWDGGPKSATDELDRERKRVVRVFQRYTPEQRANHASSHRLGHRQRTAIGEFYYTHPDVPDRAFSTRTLAARAAINERTKRK